MCVNLYYDYNFLVDNKVQNYNVNQFFISIATFLLLKKFKAKIKCVNTHTIETL